MHSIVDCVTVLLQKGSAGTKHFNSIVIAECPDNCATCTADSTTGIAACDTCNAEFIKNTGTCGGKFHP